jgi:hypothetical protein
VGSAVTNKTVATRLGVAYKGWRMTPKEIKLWSAGIASADAILTLGDKVFTFGLPGWMTSSWPFVLLGVYIFDRFAHAMIDPDPAAPPINVTPPSPSAITRLPAAPNTAPTMHNP